MSKIANFDRFKFSPFEERIGNIAVSNCYTDKQGVQHPLQTHLGRIPFSFFEVKKYYTNSYYGKLDEYLKDGWSDEGRFIVRDNVSIDRKFFTESKESAYMLGYWENIDNDESPDFKFVSERPVELNEEEWVIFKKLLIYGFEEIKKQININEKKLEDHHYDYECDLSF